MLFLSNIASHGDGWHPGLHHPWLQRHIDCGGKACPGARPTSPSAFYLCWLPFPLLSNTAAPICSPSGPRVLETTADEWIASVPGASIDNVEVVSSDVYVRVQTPGECRRYRICSPAWRTDRTGSRSS